MRKLCCIFFIGMISFCSAQNSNLTKKPFSFSGSYTIKYEQKKINAAATSGNIICAFNNFDVALIPSFANLMKDVVAAKLLVNTSFNEMTMLTTAKNGRKSGLLTNVPKAVIITPDKKAGPPVITKTGIIKSIQGFPCERIIVNIGDTTKIEAWVTNAIVLNMPEALQFINSGFRGKSPLSAVNMTALKTSTLETTVIFKNGETIKLSITDIKKTKPDPSFFSTSGFDIMDARGLPMFNGN